LPDDTQLVGQRLRQIAGVEAAPPDAISYPPLTAVETQTT
jgi:hypothetical protein